MIVLLALGFSQTAYEHPNPERKISIDSRSASGKLTDDETSSRNESTSGHNIHGKIFENRSFENEAITNCDHYHAKQHHNLKVFKYTRVQKGVRSYLAEF